MLCCNETDMPNGTLLGQDADFGLVYALNGKVVPYYMLEEYYDKEVAVFAYPHRPLSNSLFDRLVRAAVMHDRALTASNNDHEILTKHW